MTRGWMIAIASFVTVALIAGIVVVANLDDANVAEPSPSPSDLDEGPDVVGVGLDDPTADIVWLTEQGFFVPEQDGDDRPDRLVDRALLAVVWARMRELPVEPCTGEPPVADVDVERADCSAIASAYARNVAGSENAEAFRPDHRLTRAELARLLYLDSHATDRVDGCHDEPPYADVDLIDPACEAMRWATAAGEPPVVEPVDDESFEPVDNVDLALLASAIRRYYDLFVFEGSDFEYAVSPGVIVYQPEDTLSTERHIISEARYLSDGTVASPETAEWTVVLPPDADPPRAGTGVFVEPGGATTPEGLAGQVSAKSTNKDGSHLLTIKQVPLDQIFERLEGFASVTLDGYDSAPLAGPAGASTGVLGMAPRGIPLGGCEHDPTKLTFDGTLGAGIRGPNVNIAIIPPRLTVTYSLGSLVSEPFIREQLYAEVKVSVVVEGAFAAKCTIDLLPVAPSVPIAPPITVGFAPYLQASFEVTFGYAEPLFSAKGYFTSVVDSSPGGATSSVEAGKSVTRATLSWPDRGKISLSFSIGLRVQIGILGTVGIYLSPALKVSFGVELNAPIDGKQDTCYFQKIDLVISGGVFFKLFTLGTTLELASVSIPLFSPPKSCATTNVILPPGVKPPTTPPTTAPPGNPDGSSGGGGGGGGGGGSTTTPPKTLEEIRDEAMDIALEARAIAEFAEQQADEAQQAAAMAEATAAGDPIATSSAQHAAAAAQEAGEAAAQAREAADEAYAAAVAAATKGQADAALLLAQAALAYSEAAAAAVRAAAAAADAILEVKLPITHKDATAPTITIAAGDVWSLGPGDIHVFGDPYRTPYRWPAKVPVVPDVDDVVTNNAGAFLLGDDGTVWTWAYGSTPVQVLGLSDIEKVWACDFQVYAQDGSGTFFAWGGIL